jgi:hypothetical protein
LDLLLPKGEFSTGNRSRKRSYRVGIGGGCIGVIHQIHFFSSIFETCKADLRINS